MLEFWCWDIPEGDITLSSNNILFFVNFTHYLSKSATAFSQRLQRYKNYTPNVFFLRSTYAICFELPLEEEIFTCSRSTTAEFPKPRKLKIVFRSISATTAHILALFWVSNITLCRHEEQASETSQVPIRVSRKISSSFSLHSQM